MYDDYLEMFADPSEVDLIIKKAEEKIGEMLTDTAKQKAKEYAELGEKIEEAKETLYDLNGKIIDCKAELEELNKEIDVSNASKAGRYLDAVCEKYTKGFKPNDKCYVITTVWKRETCPVCGGDKRFIGKDGKEFKCPNCRGEGTTAIAKRNNIEKRTITDVWLKIGFDKDGNLSIWNDETIELRPERSGGYCGKKTVESLYKTREEAEQAIKDYEAQFDSEGNITEE